jgi:hypothetical protein
MTLAALAQQLTANVEERVRWKLVWEFLEEYRWESPATQIGLVQTAPQQVGDERWDALLAALAEYLCVSTILRRRHGPSRGCCDGHGSQLTRPSNAPMPWSTRRPRSASMASTSRRTI